MVIKREAGSLKKSLNAAAGDDTTEPKGSHESPSADTSALQQQLDAVRQELAEHQAAIGDYIERLAERDQRIEQLSVVMEPSAAVGNNSGHDHALAEAKQQLEEQRAACATLTQQLADARKSLEEQTASADLTQQVY